MTTLSSLSGCAMRRLWCAKAAHGVLVFAVLLGVRHAPLLAQGQGPSRPALTVTTTEAARVALPIRLAANGTIAAWDEAIVGTETTGLKLVEVQVAIGDQVRRGQVLAVFSSETLEAERDQARAALAEAQAQSDEARGNAVRARSIAGTDALSASQFEQYIANERVAAARTKAAESRLLLAEARLAQTRVIAPDSGLISARQATVGAVPVPGQELFRLIRQAKLEWRAEVTVDELLRIRAGAPVAISVAGGPTVSGRVRVTAPTVDAQSRNALVYVDLPSMTSSAGASLRPGMFARGQFELGASSSLVVPQSSLSMREGFSYVFRVEPDQRVSQLKVQIGRIVGERVEITSGLQGGETLVATGAGFLNDGDRVRVVQSAAPRR
jgi:HlyD family secretion protein